jgi:RHS repeat-associated protein
MPFTGPSAVARTRAETITDESLAGVDANPGGANFGYDAVGRLTDAWVPGHHYSYDFTSAADAACPTGSRANAGANTNRMRMVDATAAGSAETRYCYDDADRLLATLGATAISDVRYDDKGGITQLTQDGVTTSLAWDGAQRSTGLKVDGADPADVSYQRDATNRIMRRTTKAGDSVDDVRYGYTGSGDTPDYALSGDLRVVSRSISLPGGVLETWKPDATACTFDHPTVRGDLTLATDATGKQVGDLRSYGPYGESLTTGADDGMPDNQPGAMDYGWLGQHQRPLEHAGALALVQMGARPYSPLLGRFLSVDPVDGGGLNDYEYVGANPINRLDLDGRSFLSWVKKAARTTWRAVGGWKGVMQIGAAASCLIAVVTAPVCFGAAVATSFIANVHIRRGHVSIGWRSFMVDSAFSVAGGGIGHGMTSVARSFAKMGGIRPRTMRFGWRAGGAAAAYLGSNGMARA